MENNSKKSASLTGKVVSDKSEKTLIVAVETFKTHPKYLKKYLSTKRYKVHDEQKKFKEGDSVTFRQCRPISKNKSYQVIYSS